MGLSKEHIQEFKELLEKEKGEEVSWEEAEEGAYNLTRFAELMFDCWLEDERRKKKLKDSPKGFHLEGIGYTCFICKNSVSNEESWYDKWGIKCLICQRAIDKKVIPASCAKRPHVYLFLIKDNINTLPPKKLTESRSVTFKRDGKDWHKSDRGIGSRIRKWY